MFELPPPPGDSSPPPAAEPSRPGFPVEPRRLGLALLRARLPIAVVTMACAGAGIVVAKTWVAPRYDAATVLEWEPQGSGSPDRQLTTLVESVKLPQNLAAVRTQLDLPVTLEELSGRVDVAGSKKSSLVTITASSEEADEAARLAGALADRFLEHRRGVRATELEERVTELRGAVKRAQELVEASRAAYDAFRERYGITDLPAERKVALDQATRSAGEAELARADAQAEEARGRILRGATSRLSRMVVRDETQVDPAGARLAEIRTELTRAEARLGDEHPRVLALRAEAKALEENRPRLEPLSTQRTVGLNVRWEVAQSELTGSEASQVAAEERTSALEEQARKARNRLEWLTGLEGERDAIVSELRSREEHLQRRLADLAEAEDQVAHPKAGARVVSTPAPPKLPTQSRRKLVAVGFLGGGFVLSLLAALLRALWGLRGFTAREVAFFSRLPVLASSPWPRAEGDDDVEQLVDDLRPDLADSVLFVAAEAADAPLATTLATAATARGVVAEPWTGAHTSALRRACREAEQVVVVVRSGRLGALDLATLGDRLGRDDAQAVVVDVSPDLAPCADRVGVERRGSAPSVAVAPLTA